MANRHFKNHFCFKMTYLKLKLIYKLSFIQFHSNSMATLRLTLKDGFRVDGLP